MPGSWSVPENAPLNVGTTLLLTDGSVLAQDDFTVNWWRLRPDAAGDYTNGSWTKAAPARQRRLYFASAVLADGRVFVAGGEYGDDPNNPADLLAAEIYDPVVDRWADLPVPEGWTVIGDAPCCVLPDGTVLMGNILTGQCALFDPALNAWRQTATKRNGSTSEETWTLLPDGSVLAIDCNGHPRTERYVEGQWQNASPVPAANDLVEDNSKEVGAAILRPDGTVFALGATGVTAVFTPGGDGATSAAGGVWTAGPPLPPIPKGHLAAKDAPACLMPDGTVLCVAGAISGAVDSYGDSSVLFEFDGTALTQLSPPGNEAAKPYSTRLLLLPTGQALFTNSTPAARIFTSPNAPVGNGVPQITQAPRQVAPGENYLLRGLGFNGLSQACAYGDDASMATNYPLVRLISAGAAPRVTYCRSYGHSSMGVATGSAAQNTSFVVPASLAPGEYFLEVVANGIASARVPVTAALAAARPSAVSPITQLQASNTQLQQEMFRRDLNEVHLLIDFISGRADKSLTDLKDVPNPDEGVTGTLTAQDALNRVGLIRFPQEGPPEAQARQATLLLLVKDRLNALAYPARGLSVAFTSMYAGINSAETGQDPNINGFALAAYPHLGWQAKRFQRAMSRFPLFTVLLVFFTVYLSCDVFVSSETLRHAVALPDTDVNNPACNIVVAPDGKSLSMSPAPPVAIAGSCQLLMAQEQSNATHPVTNDAGRIGVEGLFNSWTWLLHPIGWSVYFFGPSPVAGSPATTVGVAPASTAASAQPPGQAPPAASAPPKITGGDSGAPLNAGAKPPSQTPPASPANLAAAASNNTAPSKIITTDRGTPTCGADTRCDREAAIADFAATAVNMFSNAVLPMMFGLLGTLAGVMRSVGSKVRESTLSPRDYRLTWSLLPLGMVAGLAVGLIITPNAATSSAGVGFTLSATSLSFLAGYGAEGFFTMLDNVLTRIFPTMPPKL